MVWGKYLECEMYCLPFIKCEGEGRRRLQVPLVEENLTQNKISKINNIIDLCIIN